MVVEHGVDVLEEAGAHVVRLGAELLFGDARPDHDRARQLLALHHALDGDRRQDVERRAGVVALAVSRRAFDDRIAIGDARLLRRLRDAVDVGAERDHGLARSPAGHPGRSECRRRRSSIVKPFCLRMPVRYRCVSNSWKPSSPKLKTMSTICWPRSYIDSTSALRGLLQLRDARDPAWRPQRASAEAGALLCAAARRRLSIRAAASRHSQRVRERDMRPPDESGRDSTAGETWPGIYTRRRSRRQLSAIPLPSARQSTRRPCPDDEAMRYPAAMISRLRSLGLTLAGDARCRLGAAAQRRPARPRARAAQAGAAHRRAQRLSLGAARHSIRGATSPRPTSPAACRS